MTVSPPGHLTVSWAGCFLSSGTRPLVAYVVLDLDGNIKRGSIYLQYKRACHWANMDGDSVVAVEVPRDRAPLFIRKKAL